MVSIDYLSSGVYFLLQKQIVVYVGQSRNPLSRIGQHTKDSSKVFNGVKILPCDTDKTTLKTHFLTDKTHLQGGYLD